jgi:putative DNA modification/repair radical SAM protein
MDLAGKLAILADAAKYDVSCASSGSPRAAKKGQLGAATQCGICHSFTPDGRCISLLKILLTNACIHDCQYCINRRSSDVPRVRFTVEELVTLTMEFYRRNYIEGLFLSSGVIRSADYTMEQLIAVLARLRRVEGFNGYIHVKAVPGASQDMLTLAGLFADRISANIELPSQADLDLLAPEKKITAIEQAMGNIAGKVAQSKAERRKSRAAPRFAPGGQSTQMVVGATPSTDHAILQTAARLYDSYSLKRVYYSAFSPVPKAASVLPPAPVPLVREHRLYQADWLMRFYGFSADEITSETAPNLSSDMDPKLAWALRNRHAFPIDLNRAEKPMLLRIPGLGVRSVQRILSVRRYHKLTLADLATLKVSLAKIKPFVITAEHNPDTALLDRADLATRIAAPRQLELFATAQAATTGEF